MRKFALIALIAGLIFAATAQAAPKKAKTKGKVQTPKIVRVVSTTHKKIVPRAEETARMVRERACRYAIDNMYKIEFAKVPENADKMSELMKTAQKSSEYNAIIQDCVTQLDKTDLQCITGAKTAKDIETCDL